MSIYRDELFYSDMMKLTENFLRKEKSKSDEEKNNFDIFTYRNYRNSIC